MLKDHAPKFEERTQDETLKQDWKDVYELEGSTDAFCSPLEDWVMLALSSTKPEERHFVIDSGASMHMYEGLVAQESWRLSRDLDHPMTVVTANGEVQTNEAARVYVHDLHLFVTV